MRSRARVLGVLVSVAIVCSGAGIVGSAVVAPASATAKVEKSLEGGEGGGSAGAGQRFGSLLSGWGVPAVTALAGCLLIGALASRNIGASVGIILITILALIFFLAPASVATFAKSVASTVF